MKQQSKNKSNLVLYLIVLSSMVMSAISLLFHFTKKDSIVYVDAVEIISKYTGMKEVQKSLSVKSETYKANLDTLKIEFDKSVAEYEKVKLKSTASEKNLREELIRSKEKQYYDYEQIVKEQYQKSQQEMSQQILDKVNDYIKRYGEKEGYTIIMASTHYGNIAYGNESVNITDKVLQGLNEEYKSTKNLK